jgi:hypothetical protein
MLVPLYGFLRGDTIGLVVLVHDDDKVRDLAACLQEAASVRVAPAPSARVYFGGKLLEPTLTIAESGLTALDRVDVVQDVASPPGDG